MKIIDVIFALICGKVIGFVVGDVLVGLGININIYERLILWLVFPLITLLFLWLAYLVGKKWLVIFQAAKHFLVGAFTTVVDLKLFEFFIWIFSFTFILNPIIAKGISFIFSTFIKYWGNKYWAFSKPEPFDATVGKQEDLKKELIQFFAITIVGLALDVAFFYYFTRIMGVQFDVSPELWVKLSVIFAAIAAATWNFLGYKFLVFKK